MGNRPTLEAIRPSGGRRLRPPHAYSPVAFSFLFLWRSEHVLCRALFEVING